MVTMPRPPTRLAITACRIFTLYWSDPAFHAAVRRSPEPYRAMIQLSGLAIEVQDGSDEFQRLVTHLEYLCCAD